MKAKSSAPITGGAAVLTLSGPGDLAGDVGREGRFALVVDHDRIAVGVGDLGGGAIEPRGAVDHLADALLQDLPDLGRERAGGAAQQCVLRNDIVGMARLEHADRDHGGLQRIDVARHHRLQLVDDLGADQDGIDAQMRPRRVAALAFERNLDVIGRRHHGAGTDGELADRQAGIVVHAVDFVDAETADQPVLDHRQGAGATLLRRLEDDHGGAGEIAGLGQVFRGAEQHGGVAVMAAGVHLARHRGLVRQPGLFLERQRVHVGAQPDHLATGRGAGFAAADHADDAGPADAGDDVVAAETLELVGHRCRGAVHVVAQFRMGVDIPPPGGDLAVQVGDAIDDRHGKSSSLAAAGSGDRARWPRRPGQSTRGRASCAAPWRPAPSGSPRCDLICPARNFHPHIGVCGH